jgi:hypothetical protein
MYEDTYVNYAYYLLFISLHSKLHEVQNFICFVHCNSYLEYLDHSKYSLNTYYINCMCT